VVFDTLWPPQAELIAGCNRLWSKLRVPFVWRWHTPHDAPVASCSCGIYASKEPERAADYLYLYSDVYQPHLRYRAIGRVLLWGSVVEGAKGWRAACAYPERLFLPKSDVSSRGGDVEEIRERLADYRVPIEVLDEESQTAVARAVRRVRPGTRRFLRSARAAPTLRG
jgi:hypothetical protein